MISSVDIAVAGGALTSNVRKLARPRRPNTVVLVGDSIAAWREAQIAVQNFVDGGAQTVQAYTDNGDGTMTLRFSGDRGLYPTDPVRVTAANAAKLNVLEGIVQSYTTTVQNGTTVHNVVIAYAGVRTGPVIGGLNSMTVSRVYTASLCGFYTAMQFISQQSLNTIHCAAGGAKIADALSMLTDPAAGVRAGAVDLVVCNVGTNDLYSGARTDAATIADYKLLFDAFDKLACPVAVLLIPPRTSGTSAQARTYHANVNRWLWDECMKRGYRPIDTWRAQWNGVTFIDSSSAVAAPSVNMLQSDGTHPDNPGGLALGSKTWDGIKDLYAGITRWNPASPCNVTTTTNLLGDVSWPALGGTATPGAGVINGTPPAGHALQHTIGSPTVTCSLVPRTVVTDGDAYGNRFSMVFSAITGATNTRLSKSNIQALFAAYVGQKVRFRLPVEARNLAALMTMNARFWPTFGGFVHYTSMSLGNLYPVAGGLVGVFETPDIVVPAGGFSAAEWRLDIGFANGGAGQIDVWAPEIVIPT